MKSSWKYLTTFTLVLALLLPASRALANVAANTEILNTARLTFDGGSANATVSVTVALVPAQPNVTITNASGVYTAPDTPALTNSVRITSTANGPADYTVTPSVASFDNTALPSVTPAAATVSIGASVTTGTSGTTFVTIPASGASGNDAAVNAIAVNDSIVFTVNGNTYTKQVTSTTDNGDGTFRLNWAGPIPGADVPGSGVQVGEQMSVNLSVLPGTVSTAGNNITVTVQAVVSTVGAADVTRSNTTPNSWTTPSPNVTMTKYVRNISVPTSNPDAGTGTTFVINTVTREYFDIGVTGKPGDTLEYVVEATNTGASELTGCAISDLVPVAFVDFATGAYGGKEVFYVDPDDATFTITAGAVGANQASFVGAADPNLVVNVGTGADSGTKGAIPAGKSVRVAYQVTIK